MNFSGQMTKNITKSLGMASACMSVPDQKRIDAFLRDGATSSDMMQMAVKSLGIRMRNIQVSNAKKPEDKFVMPNPKTKMHQYQFQMALKQQNNPVMRTNRPSPGNKRKNNKKNKSGRQSPQNKKTKGKKKGKNKGGRALDNDQNNDQQNCKSNLEIVPKYDFQKVPKGLKSMADLSSDQKDLLKLQCQSEGLEVDLD